MEKPIKMYLVLLVLDIFIMIYHSYFYKKLFDHERYTVKSFFNVYIIDSFKNFEMI